MRLGALVGLIFALSIAQPLHSQAARSISKPIPDLSLSPISGRAIKLSEVTSKHRATVFLLLSQNCPVSTAYTNRIARLSTLFSSLDAAFGRRLKECRWRRDAMGFES